MTNFYPRDEWTNLEEIWTNTLPSIAHTKLYLNRVIHDILGCKELFQRHMNVTILCATSERRCEETMIHQLM